MRGKIVCEHHNCWKTSITKKDNQLEIYIYFDHQESKFPILYDALFVFEFPKGRDVNEVKSLVENAFATTPIYESSNFIYEWEREKNSIRCIDIAYHMRAVCKNQQQAQSYSLYHLVYHHLKNCIAVASLQHFHKVHQGYEIICPTFRDESSYVECVAKLTTLSNAYTMIFPNALTDFKQDYTQECSIMDHPLREIFREAVEKGEFIDNLSNLEKRVKKDKTKLLIELLHLIPIRIRRLVIEIGKAWLEE